MSERIINMEQGAEIINALEGIARAIPNSITGTDVTPGETALHITPPSGKLGFNEINVAAIPPQYKNVSGTNAEAASVIAGAVFVNEDGRQTGTMTERGSVTQTIEPGGSYTIQPGHYSGGTITANNGSASVTNLDVTPAESAQLFTPPVGYDGYNEVNVAAIPPQYKNVSGTNATAADVLAGQVFVNEGGKQTGTMTNRGAVTATVGSGDVYTIPAGYHDGSGTVTGAGGGYDGNIYINYNSTLGKCFGYGDGTSFIINDGITNTPYLFNGFAALNSSVTIPDSVINTYRMFANCRAYNRPISINGGLLNAAYMMYNCPSFNSQITLPSSNGAGRSYAYMLRSCSSFNQPLDALHAGNMAGILRECVLFNQAVNFQGDNSLSTTTSLAYALYGCLKFNAPLSFANISNCAYMLYGCVSYNKGVNFTFDNRVACIIRTFSNCTNWHGTIRIRNNSIGQANVVGIVANCNNSLRKNVYCNNIAVINGTTATTSITGTAITWTATTNGYYNSVYNVYIYKNY